MADSSGGRVAKVVDGNDVAVEELCFDLSR